MADEVDLSLTPLYQNIIVAIFAFMILLVTTLLQKFGIIYQLFHKVDTKSKHHGGELVAQVLKSHDVKFIFTLCGGHISPILVASEKEGVKIVDVRHEATAVFAADAVARLSGSVGVAAVTAGPGLTNTVTAIKNAQMAESPILLLGGAAASILKGRGALQDIDQMALFKPLCKFTATVTRIRDIVPTLKQALMEAQSGTPGPVFVEFPIDTLYPYELVQREIGASGGKAKNLQQHIVNWYLNNYLCNLFAGAFEHRDSTPLPIRVPKATQEQVDSCVDMLVRAKRPVFVFGSQAVLPPVSADKLRECVENIAIPCFLGGMTRGLLGRNSSLHIRHNRRAALKEADLVILAGNVCDFRLGYGKVLPRKAKIISVNRNKTQLYKNSDMFWKPTMAVEADVASFIVAISEKLKLNTTYQQPISWLNQLKQSDTVKDEKNLVMSKQPTDVHLNPLKVLFQTEELMDAEKTILVADGGDFVGSAAYILRPRGPLKWLDPGAFGTLGVGGGFALGAKLLFPDHDVWIVYGDGSLGYSVAEFDTFTRHKCPVIALVGNDAAWTQIAREQVPMFGSAVGTELSFTDYEVVAKGYGGDGVKLTEDEQVSEALHTALKVTREEGKPFLINTLIGSTKFREGSISV